MSNTLDPKAYMSYAATQIGKDQNVDFSLLNPSDDNQILSLNDIRVSLNKTDPHYRAYLGREWYYESVNPFYSQVNDLIKPTLVLDIGGNHGVSATIAGMRMPDSHVIVVEPISSLIKHIKYNLYSNRISSFNVVNGVVGHQLDDIEFSLNPLGSLDSRVIAPNADWEKTTVPQETIDNLTASHDPKNGAYIKIDTQGYEPYVFEGGRSFLQNSQNWIIKTEYAPTWIKDQGNDPAVFLADLIERYDVFEFPARYGFKQQLSQSGFGNKLLKTEASDFSNAVSNYFRNERGWVDLLVTAKDLLPR